MQELMTRHFGYVPIVSLRQRSVSRDLDLTKGEGTMPPPQQRKRPPGSPEHPAAKKTRSEDTDPDELVGTIRVTKLGRAHQMQPLPPLYQQGEAEDEAETLRVLQVPQVQQALQAQALYRHRLLTLAPLAASVVEGMDKVHDATCGLVKLLRSP